MYTNYIEDSYAYDHIAEEGTLWLYTIYAFKRNYNYSFSLSTQTNIYEMYQIKNPNSRVKAIRHKMSPSVSFSYNPDFTDPKYGFWDTYIDENGDVIAYDRFRNGVFGSATAKKAGSISFGLT